jgi:hypothetical protein
VPAGHRTQLRIDALREPDERRFVAAGPGFQQPGDVLSS